MSDIEIARSAIAESLFDYTQNLLLNQKNSEKEDFSLLPSYLDTDAIQKFVNGEYSISLKDYTNLSTYKSAMNTLYGDNSASPFKKYLNDYLNTKEDAASSAKKFIEKLRENGVSDAFSLNMYSALQKYSAADKLIKYNYVSAKV